MHSQLLAWLTHGKNDNAVSCATQATQFKMLNRSMTKLLFDLILRSGALQIACHIYQR